MAAKTTGTKSEQDAEATRRVQELLERGSALGIAIDSNYYVTSAGGTLEVSFRSKLAQGGGRFLHLVPTIWEREIKRHLRTRIQEAREKALNFSERDVKILQSPDGKSALKALKAAAQSVDPAETANELWQQFAAETHVVPVMPALDSASTVLDWYFDQMAPFEGAGAKKNEFPDAFALHSLSRFAVDQELHVVVVVTKDGGAYEHCLRGERLLGFHDVQSALGALDAKSVIERRRNLSADVSGIMGGARLERLRTAVVAYVNQPYQHQAQPWPAVTKPSFPQNPRILIDEILEIGLVPFGNFGYPVNVTWVDNIPAGEGSTVIGAQVRAKIKARVSCEISAIDTSNPDSSSLRQKFPLDSHVEVEMTVEFISTHPLPDDPFDNDSHMAVMMPMVGITGIDVSPLHVDVPENFQYRGFA